MEAEEAAERLKAPGVPDAGDRERAVLIARVICRASNVGSDSDVKLLARAFLRECGLTE